MNTLYIYKKNGTTLSKPLVFENDTATCPFTADTAKVEFRLEAFRVPVGSEGYYMLPNIRSSSSCGGLIFFKKRPPMTDEYSEGFAVPVFGVNTGSKGVLAAVTANRYNYTLKVQIRDGFYTLSVIFSNCEADPAVKLFHLEGENATYSGMARTYRDYQLSRGICKPLKERIVNNPLLEETSRSIMVRMRMGWKPVPPDVLEQTEENAPPMHTAITFPRAAEILRLCRQKGIKHAEFCLVGWNKGGHDGAFPDLFPVEEAFGGETELRKLLALAKELDYYMSAHTNLVDSYSFSKRVKPSDRLVDPDGSFHLGGKWGGGQSYYLCPKCAYERFAREDFTALKELGFRGTHYLDVASIKAPDACHSPEHPLTREENAYWRNKTFALAREVFGAVSSEGSIDFCIGDLDYVLYTNFSTRISNGPVLCEQFIPFWTLVYHGIVTSNCSFDTVNEMVKGVPDLWLYNLEYGGRPTAYFHSKFRPAQDKVEPDLRCSTDEEMESGIEALAQRAAEFEQLSYLQFEFIDEHEEVLPNVIRERYSDGTVVIINRSETEFEGVAPKSYKVTKA